ncbi:hypothetical protein M446_2412 [Methylobacterium sp. 4-46]|uniref:hypothetical protein n=1 Tax=unclassified Methylobacterium TaxID=2615210 RepID=UPI000165C792|nr:MULTISPECIES: hypothetical protein [Methylobacterium]ACA16868.1 hypothetical protein M446_2412 [Methylobacterium sp. 4-46]WFT82558.1 hypothetical protein QA634_12210 [Methylobacterium nodulans]
MMRAAAVRRLVVMISGTAALVLAVPAEAQWGGYGGWKPDRGGRDGGAHCGRFAGCGPRPVGIGGPRPGKICYNFAGRPYLYRGGGRCPIS